MRIGIFTNYFSPSVGGIENSVISLCDGLKKAGHEFFVFAPGYPGLAKEEKNIFRYRSLCFSYGGYLNAITVPFMSQMDSVVKKLRMDIIHSQQPFLLGNDALRFSKILGKPLVFTYHTKYEDYMHYIPFFSKIVPKSYIINKVIGYVNQCDAVIAPSSFIKKFILKYGIKPPVEVIPTGIDLEKFSKGTGKRNEIRKKYKIGKDATVLVTASRLAKEKNLKFLIKFFAKIFKNNKNLKFFILGDGVLKKELEQISKKLGLDKNIIFTGWIPQEEIAAYYKASDIFIFASLTETQGLATAEAIASGLPVVALSASGVEDVVIDGENGFLVENSIDNFSRKALKIINNAELRKKMAAQAKVSSKNFSQELWIKKIVSLYESLI